MKRYANPQRCPDCSAAIGYGAPACASCSLPLSGPIAAELFATLTRADALLTRLRATQPAAAPAEAPAPATPPMTTTTAPPRVPLAPYPMTPPRAPAPSGAGMSGTSVPKILLTLGAGCLLVAALVFLAVTWSVLGVGGRTATLVGFTALTAALTHVLAHRALRGAVESLGLVTLGLATLDVVGAENAGWFGEPSDSTFLVVVGLVLAGGSAAWCLVLRRTPAGDFTAGEIVAALGACTTSAGLLLGEWSSSEMRMFVATVFALVGAAALDRLRLRVATVGTAVLALVLWPSFALDALVTLVEEPSVQGVWQDGGAWPTLAAAGVVATLAAVRRLPDAVRIACAALATALVTAVLVVPALDESPTTAALTLAGVLVVASAALWVIPRPWSGSLTLTWASAALSTLVFTLILAGAAVSRLIEAGVDGGTFDDILPSLTSDIVELQPWFLPVGVLALVVGITSGARELGARVDWAVLAPPLAISTLIATAALYPLPVWLFVAAALIAGIAYVVLGGLPTAAAFLGFGVVVGFHSDGLTAIAFGVLLVLALATTLRDESALTRRLAGAVASMSLAVSVWTWGDLLDLSGTWVAAAGLLAVAALALAVRDEGVEVGAALGMLGLFVAGGSVAPESQLWTWVAVYLTLIGSAVTIEALLRPDRREMGWAGGLFLAAATWVRLGDLGVHEPEPYTLPSAAALLVVGLLHLRRNPEAGTMGALSPGLALALVPSLLWVLVDPTTLRAVLLGLVCLAAVVAGVQLRWTALLVYGATVGSLIVLREAAPYISDSSVPRWVLIGFAGALLVALGVTWEQRVREARAVVGYVRRLR